MATSGTAVGSFTGRSRFQIQIALSIYTTDAANNRTMWNWSLNVLNLDSSSQTYALGVQGWASATVNGAVVYDAAPPSGVYDFRDGASSHRIASGRTGWIPHNSDGNKTIAITGGAVNVATFGNANATGSVVANRVATEPDRPAAPKYSSKTTSSITFTFVNPANNGSTITKWNHQRATNSAFTSGVSTWDDSNTPATASGLQPGTTYYIRSRAVNGVGASSWSPALTATTSARVPSKPAKPLPSGSGSTSVTFRYSEPDDGGAPITSWDYQLALNSSFSSGLQSWNGTGTSTSRSGLNPGTTYYIRIRARNSAGASAWSDTYIATTNSVAPSAPPRPVASTVTSSSISFTFSAPSSNGGAAITGYTHEIATNSSFTAGQSTWSDGASPASRTGLTHNTTYYVRTRAVNSAGSGPWSSTLTIKTAAAAPSKPARPVASTRTADSVAWTFTNPSNNGASITSWDHQISRNSTFTSVIATFVDATSPASRGGLEPATSYYVRSRAKNSAGTSVWSDILTISTIAGAPDKAATPTLSSRTSSSLTWNFTNPGNNGSSISGWDHQISTSSSFSSGVITISDASSPASRTGLAPATTYYIRSRAKNSAGAGAWSNTLTATTLSTTPSKPATPKETNKGPTSLEFSFASPFNGGSSITGWDHQISTSSSFSSATTWADNSTPASRTGLTPNVVYYVRSRAKNANGAGPWSDHLAVRTATTAPSQPPAPTYVRRTASSITFTIAAPSSNGGSPVTTYQMEAATNSSFTTGRVTWSATGSTQTASPLVPGTMYYIRYRAVNAVGPSAWSEILGQSSEPTGPPGLTVRASPNGTQATVTLTPPVGGAPTSYRIERRTVGQTAVSAQITESTSVTISGLTPGRGYQWRASAIYGAYQTDFSTWNTLTQPKPNTTPGDYFDGSTPGEKDVGYRWTGTANGSKSEAVGEKPLGWVSWSSVYSTQPLIRVTGGRSGGFSARVTFVRDMLEGDVTIGMDPNYPADVAESGVYWGSIYLQVPRTQRIRLETIWLNASDAEISRSQGDASVVQPGAWRRLTMQAVAPAGAVKAYTRARTVTGDGYAPFLSGEWLQADDVMITVGELLPWFSGSTRDTASMRYDWLGQVNASVSTATPLDVTLADPLADPDCVVPPAAPQPPRIVDSCIDEVGSWRRYWAIVSDAEIPTWLTIVPTITMTTRSRAERQIRVRFYPNPDDLSPEAAGSLEHESEQTVSYMPANSEFILDGVSRRSWATVGNSDTQLSADHLLHGQNGAPATWPALSCGTSYLISFDVPLDAPEGNLEIAVAVTTRMM